MCRLQAFCHRPKTAKLDTSKTHWITNSTGKDSLGIIHLMTHQRMIHPPWSDEKAKAQGGKMGSLERVRQPISWHSAAPMGPQVWVLGPSTAHSLAQQLGRAEAGAGRGPQPLLLRVQLPWVGSAALSRSHGLMGTEAKERSSHFLHNYEMAHLTGSNHSPERWENRGSERWCHSPDITQQVSGWAGPWTCDYLTSNPSSFLMLCIVAGPHAHFSEWQCLLSTNWALALSNTLAVGVWG